MQRIANPSTPVRFRPQPPLENMEKFKVDCLIIGGGVAGLAIAKEISSNNREVFLIESNYSLGQETSSRNSEVIHAGIYYKPDSLKATLCVQGKKLLYEYLDNNNISYRKCGKFILSTSDQESQKLHDIKANAEKCGINDLSFANNQLENYSFLRYNDCLFSPSTGIFDSHSFMESLRSDFETQGGTVLLENEGVRVEKSSKGFQIIVDDKNINDNFVIETKMLINCAGINSISIANSLYEEEKFQRRLVKGEYYSYNGKEILDHLIYPVPKKDSLGTHATLDLGKGIRFGPSAYEVNEVKYDFSDSERENFYHSIASYWPSIKKEELFQGYSGIRAMVQGSEDFVIDTKVFDENILISVLGYVSPGLTASLALAEHVNNKIVDL